MDTTLPAAAPTAATDDTLEDLRADLTPALPLWAEPLFLHQFRDIVGPQTEPDIGKDVVRRAHEAGTCAAIKKYYEFFDDIIKRRKRARASHAAATVLYGDIIREIIKDPVDSRAQPPRAAHGLAAGACAALLALSDELAFGARLDAELAHARRAAELGCARREQRLTFAAVARVRRALARLTPGSRVAIFAPWGGCLLSIERATGGGLPAQTAPRGDADGGGGGGGGGGGQLDFETGMFHVLVVNVSCKGGLKFHPNDARAQGALRVVGTRRCVPAICVRGVPAARLLSPATLWFLCNLSLQFGDDKAYGKGADAGGREGGLGLKRKLEPVELLYDVLLPHLAGAPLDAALDASATSATKSRGTDSAASDMYEWRDVAPDEADDPLALLRELARYRLARADEPRAVERFALLELLAQLAIADRTLTMRAGLDDNARESSLGGRSPWAPCKASRLVPSDLTTVALLDAATSRAAAALARAMQLPPSGGGGWSSSSSSIDAPTLSWLADVERELSMRRTMRSRLPLRDGAPDAIPPPPSLARAAARACALGAPRALAAATRVHAFPRFELIGHRADVDSTGGGVDREGLNPERFLELSLGRAREPVQSYVQLCELVSECAERTRALVSKSSLAPPLVVHQQLLALVEHAFANQLPLPRRTQLPPSPGAVAGRGGAGDVNLWTRAVTQNDPRFKRAMQRRMLTELHEVRQR